MAQDARDSRSQPTDSSVCDEKELETQGSPQGLPHSASNSDTQPPGPGRNSTSVPSGNASRRPDGLHIDENGNYRYIKPKLRTLPAWIRSVDYTEDEPEPSATDRLLPSQPGDALVAQHNHSPHATSRPDYRGESVDATADRYAPAPRESRWKSFSKAIAYPREQGAEEKSVEPEWLNDNLGDYSTPWRAALLGGEDSEDPLRAPRRREIWFRRLHSNLLKSPIVPLIFRLTVWCFSVTALALGGSIEHLSDKYGHAQGPSALMAIIVDAVALVYLVYITWDEYTAKPLGLRSPRAKARLILLDIVFIVFDSANLSLAFASLSSVRGSCTESVVNQEITPKNDLICARQKALASILLVALIAWLMTFSISVLRLVERVAH